MTDESIPWGDSPPADLSFATARPRRHEHRWDEALCPNCVTPWKCNGPHLADEVRCSCGKTWNDAHAISRRNRNNRKRGKHYEHGWAERLGMRQTGGLNKEDDALNDVFVGQAKSMATARFPSWMVRELDILRARWADRIPILGVLEAAGQGRKGRRLVVIDEADWVSLHVGDMEGTP